METKHTPTLDLHLVHNTDSRDIDAKAIGIHGAGLMSNGEARRIRIQHDGTRQDVLAASKLGDELITAVNQHAKLTRDNEAMLATLHFVRDNLDQLKPDFLKEWDLEKMDQEVRATIAQAKKGD